MSAIFVTGATGNQGGAAARHLLKNGFHVRALTRNPASQKAEALKKLGAEVLKVDLDEPQTYREFLKDIDGIFSVQTFEDGIEKEIAQGIALADLAKEFGVKHFIYSSVSGADLKTGIPHFKSKYKIENHIKSLGIPHTILRPTSLFENLLIPQVKSRIAKGKFVSPVNKDVVQQMLSADDVGRIAAHIFKNPAPYGGRTITLAAEQLSQQQVADTLSKALGRPIQYKKLPGIIARLAMGRDLSAMFRWVNANGAVFLKDVRETEREFGEMMRLEKWIEGKF
jgi:uncharacterized protein YbjT (DUF2867 family)